MSIPAPHAIDYKTLVQDDRIHVSLYTDPRIFADEMDRIFARGWVFVGHDSEVPSPGDFVTREIATQPVIMVRKKDGGVSVFLNRCMHRGTMLCPAAGGHTRTFACPYHGWTYDLDGTLLGVPYPGGYASFDKSAHGLRAVPRVSTPTIAPWLSSSTGRRASPTRRGTPSGTRCGLTMACTGSRRPRIPPPTPRSTSRTSTTTARDSRRA